VELIFKHDFFSHPSPPFRYETSPLKKSRSFHRVIIMSLKQPRVPAEFRAFATCINKNKIGSSRAKVEPRRVALPILAFISYLRDAGPEYRLYSQTFPLLFPLPYKCNIAVSVSIVAMFLGDIPFAACPPLRHAPRRIPQGISVSRAGRPGQPAIPANGNGTSFIPAF